MPPNIIVIVIILILAMAAIIGFLFLQWGSGSRTLTMQTEKSRACNLLVTSQCSADLENIEVEVDVTGDNQITGLDNLKTLCAELGMVDETQCRESCGCS